MKIFQAAGTLGLRTFATPTSTLVTNAVSIGRQTTQVNFPAASVAYAMRAVMTEGSNLLYDPETPNTTSGTTLVAGQGQMEFTGAAGTASAAGNVAITIGDRANAPSVPAGVPLYMQVTGTLTDGTNPVTFGIFAYFGQINGKPSYRAPLSDSLQWESDISRWVLRSEDFDSQWQSADDVATPDLADWADTAVAPATGLPVVVTSSQTLTIPGLPLTVQVPIASGDTAAAWVVKAKNALAANATVAANFDVTNTSTIINITRKPRLLGGAELYEAQQPALNISIANGTPSPGITPRNHSQTEIAGIKTDGTIIFDGEGNDFEGNEITSCNILHGELIQNSGTEQVTVTLNSGDERIITPGGAMLNLFPGDGLDVTDDGYEVEIENTGSDATIVDIVIIGQPE
jgi:hypothetical protein